MANSDWIVQLEAVIDKSSLTDTQKKIAKEHFKADLDIQLDINEFAKQKKILSQNITDMANQMKSAFKNIGIELDDKQINDFSREFLTRIQTVAKAEDDLVNSMAKVREQAELSRQTEQKRQQLAQNNAINKALEQEYQERQRNIESAKKQAELDKQNALAFTKSASEKLSSAISKYSYGDTFDANAMMEQMNRGLSNFGDLSNVQGNITQLSSTVDKIIADLKVSHEQSLKVLNQEIKAEQTLQSQKDAFNKKNLNAIDYEIQKREEEAKTFSSMLQSQMQEQQKMQSEVDKIQHSLSVGDYDAQIETIKKGFVGLSGSADEAETHVQGLRTALQAMHDATDDNGRLTAEKNYQLELEKTHNQLTIAKAKAKEYVDVLKVQKLRNDIQDWLKKNTAATQEAKDAMTAYLNTLDDIGQVSQSTFNEAKQGLDNWDTSMRQAGKLGKSLTETFKEGAKSFAQWTFSSGTVMKVWQGLKNIYNASINLDDVITDLTIATGINERQLDSLINSYSRLGEELNATVTDVIASGTEWIKQGQSIADTETLISNAMILSKIGKLSSAEATQYLTSAMKGYQVSVEDTLGVVDKLSAVDMASATDVGGLAEGMSEVASSADLAGVSMDKLLGYLAAIGEVTQSGMSEVGTTLNAVFSRMGNIKLARLKDYETGEDLSNVETVLRGVQINLRDTDNSFREFDKVLDETAGRWDNFSEVQQRAIASAFAGTHHMNEFIVLMENYDKALQYTEKSLNSSGEAMQKFETYQESVTAHTELFNKAIQDLANTAIDSGLINFFIDLGTFGVKTIDGIVNAMTPLGTFSAIGGGILGAKDLG